MKKIFAITIFLICSLASCAQQDSTKVEQYCQVIATPRLLSNKVTIDIDYGDEISFWHDNRLKTDAMNYMGKEGWIFINAHPVRMAETEIYHFAFKKSFPKSALK